MVACAAMVALRPFFLAPRRSPKDRPGRPRLGPRARPGDPRRARPPLRPRPGARSSDGSSRRWSPAVSGRADGRGTSRSGTASARPSSSASSPSPSAAVLYLGLDRIRDGLAAAEPSLPRTEGWYDAALAGLAALARAAHRRGAERADDQLPAHAPSSPSALLTWGALLARPGPLAAARALGVELIDWAITAIILASIVVVLRTHSRLTAITALGGVGAGHRHRLRRSTAPSTSR